MPFKDGKGKAEKQRKNNHVNPLLENKRGILCHKNSSKAERNKIEWVPISASDVKVAELRKYWQDGKQGQGCQHQYDLEITIQAKKNEGDKKTENKTGEKVINCLPSLENRINCIGRRSPGEGGQASIAFVVKN
jgi:hypothetical protein